MSMEPVDAESMDGWRIAKVVGIVAALGIVSVPLLMLGMSVAVSSLPEDDTDYSGYAPPRAVLEQVIDDLRSGVDEGLVRDQLAGVLSSPNSVSDTELELFRGVGSIDIVGLEATSTFTVELVTRLHYGDPARGDAIVRLFFQSPLGASRPNLLLSRLPPDDLWEINKMDVLDALPES